MSIWIVEPSLNLDSIWIEKTNLFTRKARRAQNTVSLFYTSRGVRDPHSIHTHIWGVRRSLKSVKKHYIWESTRKAWLCLNISQSVFHRSRTFHRQQVKQLHTDWNCQNQVDPYLFEGNCYYKEVEYFWKPAAQIYSKISKLVIIQFKSYSKAIH